MTTGTAFLGLGEEQRMWQDTVRRFLEAEVPLTTVRKLADTPAGFDREWWRRAADLGAVAVFVPEEHGGGSVSGGPVLDLALVAEQFGRLVSPGPLIGANLAAAAIAGAGSAKQQAEVLASVVRGEAMATWCLKEPDGAWNGAEVRTRATRTADGGFRLTGVKTMVEAAAQADLFVVVADLDGEVAQFLVPAGAPGVRVDRLTGLDLTWRFGEVHLRDTVVAGSALLEQAGSALVDRLTQIAAVLTCAMLVGGAGRVFEFTTEFAFLRRSFGRPLASYQVLKHRFADMALWLEASRATTAGAATALDAQTPDAGKLASVAKAYVGEQVPELIQAAVQMHGAMGVTWEHDLHLYLRRATAARALYGGPAEHRARVGALPST